MCTDAEWLLKHGTTASVNVPDHPGLYIGTTHATKFRYKEELGIYSEYKEHMDNKMEPLTSCFTEGLLIDLETDREVIRYTASEIYNHVKNNSSSQEIYQERSPRQNVPSKEPMILMTLYRFTTRN